MFGEFIPGVMPKDKWCNSGGAANPFRSAVAPGDRIGSAAEHIVHHADGIEHVAHAIAIRVGVEISRGRGHALKDHIARDHDIEQVNRTIGIQVF